MKNYLFSVVYRDGSHEHEIEALERRWEAMVGQLGSESFPNFLRVHWKYGVTEPIHLNSLKPGHRLHWYRIEKVLGQGSFGITYLAHDSGFQ